MPRFVVDSAKRPSQVERQLAELREAQKLVVVESGAEKRFIRPAIFQSLEQRATAALKEHFANDRLSRGLPKAELQKRLLPDAARAIAPVYLDWLEKRKVLQVDGDVIQLPGRTSQLNDRESELAENILAGFRRQGLTPGSPDELCRDLGAKPQVFQGVVKYLVERKSLVRLSSGLMLSNEAVEELKAGLLATGWSDFSVPEFKDHFGLTRKWAIPLLEHLDQIRLTVRSGDRRRILRPRSAS